MSHTNSSVFGIYPDESEVLQAIEQLKRTGFRTADLSILVPENLGSKDIGHEKHTKAPEGAVAGSFLGALAGGVLGWLVNAGTLAISWPGAQQIAGASPAIAILAGIGALGMMGALVGAIMGGFLPEYEAVRYAGRMRSGRVLVSVHCDDNDWQGRARRALHETGAKGIGSKAESKADFGRSEKPMPKVPVASVLTRKTFLSKNVQLEEEMAEKHESKELV